MFRETLRQDDSVVGLACEGKLGQDELKRMHALLHERLAAPAKPGLVVDLEKFDGYESFVGHAPPERFQPHRRDRKPQVDGVGHHARKVSDDRRDAVVRGPGGRSGDQLGAERPVTRRRS